LDRKGLPFPDGKRMEQAKLDDLTVSKSRLSGTPELEAERLDGGS
jgi:hypothetical protein